MNNPITADFFDKVSTKDLDIILSQFDRNPSIQRINVDCPKPTPYFITERELNKRKNKYEELLYFGGSLINKYIPNNIQDMSITLTDNDGCVLFSLNQNHIGAVCPGFMLINQDTLIKESLINGNIVELYSKETNEIYICIPITTEDSPLFLTLTNKNGNHSSNYLDLAFLLSKLLQNQYLWTRNLLHVSRFLLESVEDCALIIDEDGFIVEANSNFLKLLGIDSKEFIKGVHIKDIFTEYEWLFDSDKKGNDMLRVNGKNKSKTVEIVKKKTLISPSGSRQFVILFKPVTKAGISNFHAAMINKKNPGVFQKIITINPKMKHNIGLAQKVAQLSTTVLIEGQSGTGKDLMAQCIHNASGRKGLFVPINCGAIPKELLQSELFGYSEGAFTGAKKGGKPGKIETADGGTLFLDEIGEMPMDMQVSLLRFLQNKTFTPVGSNRTQKVNVRIIAATNKNLSQEVEKGSFRRDLYYRLNVIHINMPPLCERKEDIPLLAENILEKICKEYNIPLKSISSECIDLLLHYNWPGNVRELHNILERAVVLSENDIIEKDHILFEELAHKDCSKKTEEERLETLLKKHNGNISAVAREMGVARSTIYRKMKKRT